MNKVFEKNISVLKDSQLRDALVNYTYNIKPELVSTNGYNIKYNGVTIHNEQNPLVESAEIFKTAENSNNIVHIIYGLGLGYLFQIASRDSKGMVILYEPNLDILYNAFTLVDFSQDLIKDNVSLFTEFKKITDYLGENSKRDSSVAVLSYQSYREMYKDVFAEQVKQMELAYGSVLLDYGFKRKKLLKATINTLRNIPQLIKETPVNLFEDIYKDETAIIVSAGPTLGENIETLKKYQDNAVIFSVGPALKTLVKNGIKTDFLCMIESLNCSGQVSGLDLSEMNLIVEPYTNAAIHSLEVKNKLLHISANMPPSEYFAKISGIDTEGYNTQGTVSFLALNTAVKMGFKKIILVGQDLSYIDGQCYSKDSAYEDLVCKLNPENNKYEITALDLDKFADYLSASSDKDVRIKCAEERLKILNSSLYTVKGIDGNMVPTEAGYASFIKHFADYALSLNELKLINTSLKGAQIDGFENKSLEDVMKNSKPVQKIELETNYKYDTQKILGGLSMTLNNLKEYESRSDECGRISSRLLMDLKRDKSLTREKLLKIRTLIENYTVMNDVDVKGNEIFRFVTTAEEMLINDFLKTLKTYDENNTPIAVQELKTYFTGIKKRIEAVKTIITEVIQEIK